MPTDHTYLNTPIEYLRTVGPARANLLKSELGIFTFGYLLEYYPFRYLDRTRFITINQISETNNYIVTKGVITDLKTVGEGRKMRLTAFLRDNTGCIELVWFQGIKWVKESLKTNVEYLVLGRPTLFNGSYNIAHPDLEPVKPESDTLAQSFIPIYSSTEKLKARGLSTKGISKLMAVLLGDARGNIPETMPQYILNRFGLMGREQAMFNIHFPKDSNSNEQALRRLKFEEVFMMQLEYLYAKTERQQKSTGFVFNHIGDLFNTFYNNNLPFELTNAQKRVVREIYSDMRTGKQMNRLLQGDVGSGKTLVALLSMLIACDNGYQACLMAPTEILATQHFASIGKFLHNIGIEVELLTGSTKPAQKKKIKERLQNGEINILIGTHALIEKDVVFANLGLAVIDEQHRFGVEQRAKMWAKNTIPPHVLVMTATPIPRTLAMTVYGDLDCSVIDELPPGRKPIQTFHKYDSNRLAVFGFMRRQIEAGHQIYVVYPLINESEKLDLKDLMDGYESITRAFPQPQFQVSIVHGQMKTEAKDYEMERFKRGETHIMVSTTVIEVGVDVPNASVMVIENAERFGLSQLHQLRGRVGRGAEQSYCILMTSEKLTSDGRARIKTMVETTDGFKIAEADLKLRGPGDLQGLQQSGVVDLKLADIVQDENMIRTARDTVNEILAADPQLLSADNTLLKKHITRKQNKINWGRIS
ncbi:MAG: ATP-dependent DNA helicase RecG [Bacteroidales bacterium]|nr:ATP-dependent DNA helicase RecG [Bacteroidales bacterium]